MDIEKYIGKASATYMIKNRDTDMDRDRNRNKISNSNSYRKSNRKRGRNIFQTTKKV
jgi:hypothetical protein